MASGTMAPARVLTNPTEDRFQDEHRMWQGIPSIERTAGGRLYVDWYSGMETETGGNFVVVTTSDDDGRTWSGPRFVVEHPDPEVRVYDPALWRDPSDRLWMFWNQSRDFFDGRVGVWVSVSDDPDADTPSWSAPRRIANGLQMNKPTVLSDGTWLFPTAIWACHEPTEQHALEAERFSNVYASTDQGRTIEYRGSADVPNRSFDEHMVVEKQDGTLWMLVRCFDGVGESFSSDGGRTWTPGRRSHVDGPCSRFHVRRLPSGRLLMVNHVDFGERRTVEELELQGNVKEWKGRTNLTALLSDDDGATWPHRLLLDDREDVSYPDAAIGPDGQIFVTYDHDRFGDRGIYLARITEDDILAGSVSSPGSALRVLVNRALARAV
ncbi:exo-alpha-sialidase [Cellulosimicrobium cellulans]|uniref:sialidase family protein n=1 Tax=Cellulosimicrobium cellulans TaxID=1710 RepID=UPI0019649C65|nr:sialidase family protein [Cellulosimicrobium cellulans]MBN0040810.1 exo-alpha-sialidase [Cellulosimicrobium cellulans]